MNQLSNAFFFVELMSWKRLGNMPSTNVLLFTLAVKGEIIYCDSNLNFLLTTCSSTSLKCFSPFVTFIALSNTIVTSRSVLMVVWWWLSLCEVVSVLVASLMLSCVGNGCEGVSVVVVVMDMIAWWW